MPEYTPLEEHEAIIGTVTTRADVERGLFEAIRKKIVDAGYLPDQVLYEGEEDPEAAYEAAMEALRVTLPDKKLIEVFGIGSSRARDVLKDQFIVIEYYQTASGDIKGGDSVIFTKYDKEIDEDTTEARFRKEAAPPRSSNITYEIRYFTDTAQYDRIIDALIREALGYDEKYIPTIKADGTEGQSMYVVYSGDVDLTTGRQMEKMLRYVCMDLRIGSSEVLDAEVYPTDTMNFTVQAVKDFPETEEEEQ